MHSTPHRRAFALVELAVVAAIALTLTVVLLPALSHARNSALNQASVANLHLIGQISAQYSADNADAIFTYSWKAGIPYPNLRTGKLKVYTSDQDAASAQAANILMLATGRLEGQGRILTPTQRLVHRRYSHLPLADYMGGPAIMLDLWNDPADANQINWRNNPLAFLEAGSGFPYADGQPDVPGYDTDTTWTQASIIQLWPFASSYQAVPASWSQDTAPTFIPIEDTPHLFAQLFAGAPPVPLGGRTTTEVRAPSAKVHMFEEFDREQPGSPYFAYDHARPAKLMFDASVNTLASGRANSSTSPEAPNVPWAQRYVPLDTFPIPLDGLGSNTQLNMRYRWTRGGLQGLDYPILSPRAPIPFNRP
jgi:Tfp pilus assembly protein PilE